METKKQLEYHCDKETFLKLKEINKHLTAAKHAYAAWARASRKTVHKKPFPDLDKYSYFIKDFPRGKCPYKNNWKNPRSNRSCWLTFEDGVEFPGAYQYIDDRNWVYSYNIKRKDRNDEYDKNMAEEKWYYLDTDLIDRAYSICKKPISDDNKELPGLTKKYIDRIYDNIFH